MSSFQKQPAQSRPTRNFTRISVTTIFLLLLTGMSLSAQEYRSWADSSIPKQVIPTHIGPNPLPIGIYFYHYNHNYPATDIWTYLDSVNADHAQYFVENYYDGYRQQDRWDRYTDLIESAPTGLGILPVPTWKVSILDQIDQCREVTFYPFDSSQLGGVALTGMEFFVGGHEYEENVFTSFDYDTTEINEFHRIEEDFDPRGQQPRREAHYDTGMANQTVASGLAFDFKDGQTERWRQTWNGSSWVNTANPIGTSMLFDNLSFDGKHSFRGPHFLVVTGRLFLGGASTPAGSRIRVNVYYEVGNGQTYIDSNDIVQTADTNLRFLYKSIEWTKDDLKPVDPGGGGALDWNAHRIITKQINFEEEGMGGPTAEGITARGIDIEIIYLGEEKVALHSLAIRDSVAHSMLREDATGDAFRTAMKKQIDSLLLVTAGTTYPKTAPDGIQNLYITDEPKPFSALALRRAKEEIENNYVYASGDKLTTGNGWALPHLQWNGAMNWTANGSYYTHYTGNLGEPFGLTFQGEPLFTIPSEKHHNGGRFTVPEMFDIDELDDASYVASMPGRIDTMNQVMQYARIGAALPDTIGNQYFWLVESLYESALWSRLSGTRHRTFVGPVNAIQIRIIDSTWISADTTIVGGDTLIDDHYTYQRDTLLEHRPERSETRLLVNLSLAYGAKHLSYYTFESVPWARKAAEDGLVVKDFTEIGLCGLSIDDRTTNVLDWKLLDPNPGNAEQDTDSTGALTGTLTYDSLGIITDLYVGWHDTYREIKQSNAWVQRVAPTLVGLQWRDAYSMHFAVDAPYTAHDNNLPHRPLPSDEIITSVSTRHPITGDVDSAWATFVELGLFDTKLSFEENVEEADAQRDSNYVLVVNRRSVETGNYDQSDIGYSAAIKKVLDTLSETRTIRLDFNLGHPDSTQYAFIRVREVEPDTVSPLPLIGVRTGLDTIVYGDSAVELTLGAGRAALLEVTYAEPDESIIDGDLRWNNQRKMIYFDDDRYHATYLRGDTVYYRRSMAMGENPASILWEPLEELVSVDANGARTQNWTPSITGRVWQGDTVVTIVWTCHSNDSSGVRDVVIRDIGIPADSDPVMQPIRFVDYHSGTDSTLWGDAVITSAHGGDMIAWGDSLLGVVSRIRLRAALGSPPAFSNRALVSQPYHDTVNNRVGRWPSLPAFAHRASKDSNCAIVWNQPIGGGVNSRIYYQRILQGPIAGGVPAISLLNFTPVTWNPSPLGRPSIDQTQDLWHRLQEGITFCQDRGATTSDLLWYRSMWTSVNAGLDGDTINATQAWSSASLEGPNGGGGFTFDTYPTVSSLNDFMVLADTNGYAHFAISWIDRWSHYTTGDLYTYQANMQYAMDTFRLGWPLTYTFGGDHPHGSASSLAQKNRHAVLYETTLPGGDDVLRTTREFYAAKSRPSGYVAKGRRTIIPIDRTSGTYFELLAHDPWIADDASGTALSWVSRDPSKKTDTLLQVEELLRTHYFSAGDSTAIGLELQGHFFGDSTKAPNTRISLIAELVDSTNGAIIEQLDSIAVTAAADSHLVVLEPEYDLLSSTYYIRVRLDTSSLVVAPSEAGQEIYQVAEHASMVPTSPAAKFVRHLGPTSGNGLRISAQPNPADDRVELRFSVRETTEVTVVLIDGLGREVSRPVESVEYPTGRYSVEVSTDNLPSGSYIVEMRSGRDRAVTRLVVR